MRDIKFRAWDKRGEAWQNSLYPRVDELSKGITDRYILMQFTGLLDKNGKEIYEGDLIKIKRTIFEIRWDLFKFCFARYKHSTMENYYLTMFDKDCEVIGNIYENKELLKDTK